MDYNTKRKVADRVIYIVLAAIAVTIMLVTVIVSVTTASKRNEPAPATSDLAETTAETDKPYKPQTSPATLPPSQPEQTQPTVAPVTEPEELPVARPQSLPIQGYLLKSYSADLPVYSLTMNDYRCHVGIDISAEEGSAVLAFMSGTVTEVTSDYFMGTCLTVDHGDGLVSRYMNISEQLPANIGVGAEVDCGQVIAAVKDTALIEAAEESHLHFELLENGVHVDPTLYVSYDTAVIAYEE